MKLNDVLAVIDNSTKIKVVMMMYGMHFSTEHYARYFLDCEEAGNILDKRIIDMRVIEDNVLDVVLADK